MAVYMIIDVLFPNADWITPSYIRKRSWRENFPFNFWLVCLWHTVIQSLSHSEMQFITTLMFYFTPVRMTMNKKINDNNCILGCGERVILMHCSWQDTLVSWVWELHQKYKIKLFCTLVLSHQVYTQEAIHLTIKALAHQYLLLLYSQQMGNGINLDFQQRTNR